MPPAVTLPVTLIAGYLGAGKTTLVNHLLSDAHGRRICVLVNDFGEIALDADLIQNREGDVLALSNGCMCCSIGNDFYAAIDRILRLDPLPEHLVIETSGVADPFKVGQVALAEPELDLLGVVVVVDAVNFPAALDDRFLGDTLRKQLSAAGLVVVTKPDLVDGAALDDLRGRLATLTPGVPRLVAEQGRAPAEMFFARQTLPPRLTDPRTAAPAHDHDHAGDYRGWVWTGDARADPAALDALLRAEIPGLYRLKGVIRLTSGEWCAFHRAGLHAQRQPAQPPAAGGRAVAVGFMDSFDPAHLDAAFAAVLAAPPSA